MTKQQQRGRSRPVTLADMNARLARIESRLVALMKYQGMKTDGRNELAPSHPADVTYGAAPKEG